MGLFSFFQSSAATRAEPPAEAKRMLEKAGYEIKITNKKASIITKIDGRGHLGSTQADYVAEKNGKKYAVLALTGLLTDPAEPSVRRKLLECALAFKALGLIYVDLDKAEIHEIAFEFPKEAGEYFFQFFLVFFVIGALIGIIWLMVQLKLF